jgi:transposase
MMSKTRQAFAAYIGIDWADQKHDISLSASIDGKAEYKRLSSTPEALSEWLSQLRQRFPEGKIAICLEQSRGSLVYHLMSYDFIVLYPVNPMTLAKYRKAFKTSGAKDDRPDADLLRELICVHRKHLRPWYPGDETSRSLALLAEARRKAVNDRAKYTNRLQAVLKTFFPQALELTGARLYDKVSLAFLGKWERLEDIQRAQDKTIRKFYTSLGSRSTRLINERLQHIRSATPLTKDKAIITSSIITVRMLVHQLVCLQESIGEYDLALAEMFEQHPDKDIFSSFPGVGDVLKSRLIAAFGTDRDRFDKAENIQEYSGIAPVTKRSGKTSIVHRRLACSKFLLQTFHEFARCSLKKSVWAKAFYEMQRDKGKGHHAAIRSLAFKWIRIIYRCWRDRVCYDEVIYLKSLQRNQSPLLKYIAN